MPVEIISNKSAEHYKWGGTCDGWHLVKSHDLSIIEELMPPKTSEVRHSHFRAHQFFFVLEGELTMHVEDVVVVLQAGEGIKIGPGEQHQALNQSNSHVRMIVTSQPSSHGDRIIA